MSEEQKPGAPDPIEAARKGIGLLIEAARLTIDRLPTAKVEEAVLAGAKEVGRVFESVTDTLEEKLKKHTAASVSASPPPATPVEPEPEAKPDDAPKAT